MDLPPYVTFLDGKNMSMLWGWFKWIMFALAPIIMIYVAIEIVDRLSTVVKDTVDEDETKRRHHDDYDY